MKKLFLSLVILMIAGLQTVNAQGFRVYNSDGTVLQFSLRTDSIVFYDGIGSEQDLGLFTPANQCIVGTWYKSKSESVTFYEDGTTDYNEYGDEWIGGKYEFFPFQGNLVIYSNTRNRCLLLHVANLTKESMIMGRTGASDKFYVYTRTQPEQLVTDIMLNETSITLNPDEIKTLTAIVLPEDADNPTVTWESSNEAVAEVNKNGRIIANDEGTCTITCRATNGSGVYAECHVTVVRTVSITNITLNKTSLSFSLPSNNTQTLTATIQPSNATNKNVTWSSSNTSVATVDQAGKVTAVGSGTCTITATAADGSGVKAECTVTAVQLVTGITLNKTSLSFSLPNNNTQTLTATVQPTNATNNNITWSSSNTSIATVNQAGKVTAVGSGTCTITATAVDGGGIKAECVVTVVQLVTGITLNKTSLSFSLPTNNTQALTATIQPANATNKSITWSSDKTSVATVDQTGKVTAVAEGTCTITCSATDGSGVKASCSINVEDTTHGYTNGYEWVDLGLPSGTLWATCNVGANSPEQYGGYYACGETSEKIYYHFNSYAFNDEDIGLDIAGTNYDVAHVLMGNPWRMPSKEQQEELIQYCSHQWTKLNGVNGMLVTGTNGGHIFLPACGRLWDYSSNPTLGREGFYWSSTFSPDASESAYYLYIGSPGWELGGDFGGSGRCVRAVCK